MTRLTTAASLAFPLLSLLTGTTQAHPAASSSSLEERQSALPVGQILVACTQPGTVAITFDDGPHIYTSQLLDILSANGQRATFFVNGQNYGNINDHADTVRRMIADGHQVGSHTWSHPNLPGLSDPQIESEMTQLESALQSITGTFPTYMRPPFFASDERVLAVMGRLGYHVINADIDTLDYNAVNGAEPIEAAAQRYRDGLARGGTISLAHDPLQQTVQVLAQEMINAVRERGLRSVPVGECLGDPAANWYRTGR